MLKLLELIGHLNDCEDGLNDAAYVSKKCVGGEWLSVLWNPLKDDEISWFIYLLARVRGNELVCMQSTPQKLNGDNKIRGPNTWGKFYFSLLIWWLAITDIPIDSDYATFIKIKYLEKKKKSI